MTVASTRAPEETRRKILSAAFDEFYRNGFQGASISRIVEKTGTTKGALFYHFPDKQKLGYAVLDEVIQPHLKARWADPIADSIDPVTDLKRLLRSIMKEEAECISFVQGCPLNNLAQEMSPLDEGFRKRIEHIYQQWRQCLESAFARGIKAGNVRKNVAPRNTAVFIVAALTGILGTAKHSQSPEMMKQAAEALFDYLDSLKS